MMKLTCNQLIVLLAAYRGSLEVDSFPATYAHDKKILIGANLLDYEDEVTQDGVDYIKRILEV